MDISIEGNNMANIMIIDPLISSTFDHFKIIQGTGITENVILNNGTLILKDIIIEKNGQAAGNSINNNGQLILKNTLEIKD